MSDARPARARTPADASQRLGIADLLKELVTDIGDLFRTELRLAKRELQDSIGSFKIGLIAIGWPFLLQRLVFAGPHLQLRL